MYQEITADNLGPIFREAERALSASTDPLFVTISKRDHYYVATLTQGLEPATDEISRETQYAEPLLSTQIADGDNRDRAENVSRRHT